MKIWTALAFGSFGLITAVLYLQYDLRGWTPANPNDPAAIAEPTRPGDAAFAIGECVPGTVSPWNAPTAEEYAGTATLTVLTCRSRTSAVTVLLGGLTLAAAALVIALLRRRLRTGKPAQARQRGAIVPN